jgi:HEAT repeat protein
MNLKRLKQTPPWDWPEDADRTLFEILANSKVDDSDRVVAAELAGSITVINDELVEVLLSILQGASETEELRCMAAISLGPILELADTDGFDDPEDVPISEDTFHQIQESLYGMFQDAAAAKTVRRRVLEASIRAPQDWHKNAIRTAYSSNDEDWILTAVFSMRWVHGFNSEILEALDNDNQDIHYEAVCAAGNWEVDAAWPHVLELVSSEDTDKYIRLAAIESLATIRPLEAEEILLELVGSDDGDIADAAHEALAMARGLLGYEDDAGDEYDGLDEDDEFDEFNDDDEFNGNNGSGYVH